MNNPPKRPGASRPPPPTVTSSQRPPANLKDALAEARAVSGGSLGRPSSVPGSISPTGAKARKVVMLVDPDASMRARMRAAIEAYYDVIECKDGMEAVEMAGTMQPPAMIVSENVMPRVDGFTLAKVLRQHPTMKKVPIMFFSTRNSAQDVTQALVLGACQYVLKTVSVTDVVAKIRKIVT